MLEIIRDGETVEEVTYQLLYSTVDAPGCGWGFDCDEFGEVDVNKLSPEGLEALLMCRRRIDKSGRAIRCDGIECYPHVYQLPAALRCVCGGEVLVESGWINACGTCGREYNSGGQALAPRHHWGEETGEHWADLVAL